MIYHVEVGHEGRFARTDTTTKSLHYAEGRRSELDQRGEFAQVVTGSGRLVIDLFGNRQ